MLEIYLGAVPHRAMWGYGVDPPADINPIWVWRRASQPDQPALQPTAITTRLVGALVVMARAPVPAPRLTGRFNRGVGASL